MVPINSSLLTVTLYSSVRQTPSLLSQKISSPLYVVMTEFGCMLHDMPCSGCQFPLSQKKKQAANGALRIWDSVCESPGLESIISGRERFSWNLSFYFSKHFPWIICFVVGIFWGEKYLWMCRKTQTQMLSWGNFNMLQDFISPVIDN